MSKKQKQRGLSDEFMKDLQTQGGLLRPLLDRVHKDATLDMEIREDYVNVYYRGGNILRVKHDGAGYTAFFEPKYADASLSLPYKRITTVSETQAWLYKIPVLKNAMDLWFGDIHRAERDTQQLVVYENNASPWAGGTDYFVVDLEYDNHIGAKFDLVALQWKSDTTARKLKKYLPKLTAIEIKTGDGALKGKAGLLEHYRQWAEFFADASQMDAFKREMLRVFKQKRELGLIPALEKNKNEVVEVANDLDVIFLLANHDPASTKLITAVDEIRERLKMKQPNFNIRFATATFMGFGLYSQNILSLDDFRLQLDRLAGKKA